MPGFEKEAVPGSVLALVRRNLNGPSIELQNETSDVSRKIALSLSQLLMFNVKKIQKRELYLKFATIKQDKHLSLYILV